MSEPPNSPAPRIYACPAGGYPLRTSADAVDLIAQSQGADCIAIPTGRLSDDFYRLRTGVAGDFLQKFATYRKRVAVVGDISAWIAASDAFRDFVREANRGEQIWFVANAEELTGKLSALA